MAVCEKCGASCNQLFKGGKYLGISMPGCNPESPEGRGYYMVCKECLNAKNRADANESAVTTAISYFILQLALFASPGLALFFFVNKIFGAIIAIAGIVGYFILRTKYPKILKIIDTAAVVIVILCVAIRGCTSSKESSETTANETISIIPEESQEEVDTSAYDGLIKNIEESSSEYSPMF